ncbi:MAG: hypothetical protein GWP08_05795 [Nitrospiraceae bacterium]|nr:hypothetical protein [Nitrospiraceae bacterium]
MMQLERTLENRLTALDINFESRDPNTLVLNAVPVNTRFFNKERTNILVRRLGPAMPFLVCVDEDLKYVGADPALTRTFATGVQRQGWRGLVLRQDRNAGVETIVEQALRLLGTDGEEPRMSAIDTASQSDTSLLAAFATDLTALVRNGARAPTVGRAEEIDQAAACLIRWSEAGLALVTGDSGVGKSNLLHGVAAKLATCRPELTLLTLDLSKLFAGALFDAERETMLCNLLDELAQTPERLVAIERLDLAVRETPHGPMLLIRALDNGVRLAGTAAPTYLPRFHAEPLGRRVHTIELEEMEPEETLGVLLNLREALGAHHRVEIDDSIARATVAAAGPLEGNYPAKAVTLLDAAAAKAALGGTHVIGLDDVYYAAKWARSTPDPQYG